MKRALPFIFIALVLAAGLLTFRYLQRPTAELPPPLPPSPGSTASPSVKTVNPGTPGAEPPHAHGNPSAAVTLEEFGDFQCPPCGMLHPILEALEAEYGPAKLRVIFREYPLLPAHPHALNAARSAEAAGLQGKFWEMHDMIYETQAAWKDAFDAQPIFEGYATKIGLNLVQFRRDLTGEIVQQRIFLDGKRARSLGVQGTPTVFLNGREVPFESLVPEKLKVLIDNELSAQK